MIIISILVIIINIILALLFPQKIIIHENKINDKNHLLSTELVKTNNDYHFKGPQNILIQNNDLKYVFKNGKLHISFANQDITSYRTGINTFEIANSNSNKKIIANMNNFYNKQLPFINSSVNDYGVKVIFRNNTLNQSNNCIIFVSNNKQLLIKFINQLKNSKFINISAAYFKGQINTKDIQSVKWNFNQQDYDNIFAITSQQQINEILKGND